MPAEENEFRQLLKQVQGGSQAAVCELIERYGPHIVRVVRRRLSKQIRAKFDSLDFVQAVWASFFADSKEFTRFDQPEDLVGHLATLAHNKVVDEIRRRMKSEKYNVNRERSLNDSGEHFTGRLANREPSPSQLAIAHELWARLLEGQPDRYRRILELRRAGNTHQQIADQLGLNEKTVRRVIQKVLEEQTP